MDKNLYNTITGARLNTGESYTNAQGKTITQGSNFIPDTIQPNTPTISSKDIQPITPINIPIQKLPETPNIEGDIAFFNQLQKQSAQEQKLESEKTSTNQEIEQLLKDFSGQGTEQLGLEQQIVNPLQTQIADLTGQVGVDIADYQKAEKQYEKLKNDLEVGVRGTGNADIRASMLFGQQGAVDRAKASELNVKAADIAVKQAQILSLQGKAELAQKQIDRAIDLKYKGIEKEIEIKKFNLENIKNYLTKEEKKQADARNYALTKEEKRIAEQKQNEKDIQKMIVDATPNAPANIIANAKSIADRGGSTLEVAQALGKYGGDYLKTELLKQQIETEKAQKDNIKANTAKIKSETGGGKPPTGAQSTASGYASRVVQAKDIIDANANAINQLGTATYFAQRNLPNALQSPVVQKQLQAERNFINAVLRRESGAAISESEFENARQQYFPMPGDSAEVLAQKKANRDLVSRNLINESGSAYQAPQQDNKFQQSLGGTPERIPGTIIIQSVLPDGSLNFNLPK